MSPSNRFVAKSTECWLGRCLSECLTKQTCWSRSQLLVGTLRLEQQTRSAQDASGSHAAQRLHEERRRDTEGRELRCGGADKGRYKGVGLCFLCVSACEGAAKARVVEDKWMTTDYGLSCEFVGCKARGSRPRCRNGKRARRRYSDLGPRELQANRKCVPTYKASRTGGRCQLQ